MIEKQYDNEHDIDSNNKRLQDTIKINKSKHFYIYFKYLQKINHSTLESPLKPTIYRIFQNFKIIKSNNIIVSKPTNRFVFSCLSLIQSLSFI